MKVAIHQPQYFPWLGYFDKMAKVDKFILMDEVQLEDRSYMLRNRFLSQDGSLTYLSVTAAKKGYREKKYNQIETVDNEKWQNKHRSYLQQLYRRSPFADEVLSAIDPVFSKHYVWLTEVTQDSILACMRLLNIQTPIILQSQLRYQRNINTAEESARRRSQDVLSICKAVGATSYMTGAGASLEFLDREEFSNAGVPVAIQSYQCPAYEQRFASEFLPNISALDMLFNCGIERSRDIFWNNVKSTNEFGGTT